MQVRLPRYVVEKRGRFYVRRVRRVDGRRVETYARLPHPLEPGFRAEYERITGGGAPASPRAGTVAAMIAAYQDSPEWAQLSASAQSGYARALRKLGGTFGEFEPYQIELRHVIAWRDTMRETPAEANHCISRARTLWAWAIPRGLASDNPCEHAPRLDEAEESAPIPIDIVRRFVCEARPEIAQAVALGFYTSQRKSDLLRLAPVHMVSAHGAEIVQAKTRKKVKAATYIEFNAHAVEILQALWPADPETPFLRNSKGNPWSPQGFSDAFAKERVRLGISPQYVFHGLRHSAATIVAGEKPDLVPALLGHADARTSARYTRTARQRRDASAAARIIPVLRGERGENGNGS
ncbi:MAG: tyrosine-type recombinase/integrase [Pseudomonadota bacterium]